MDMVNETVVPNADTISGGLSPKRMHSWLDDDEQQSPSTHAEALLTAFGPEHCSALAREILTHIQRQRMRRGVIQE